MPRPSLLPVALGAALLSSPSLAQDLPQPQGRVILTVTGDIANTNQDGKAVFDLEMLREIGATEVATETIWTSGTPVFTGVPLVDFLDRIGAEGEMIDATAVNDYAITIPVSDAVEGGPILAYEMDGKVMSRREKGPLWVIYPYDSSPDYRTEVIYSRSIWQLDRMHIHNGSDED